MAILGGNKAQEATSQATAPAPAKAPATPEKAPAKRGPKPGVERKSLDSQLDLSGLEVATVTDPREMAKARRTRGERSADQKRLDAMVETAWKAWVEAGKPSEWPRMPGVKLRIQESQFETLQAGIRKAGQFYDLKVRFGKVSKNNGVCEVVFVVTDRPEKDNGDDENED